MLEHILKRAKQPVKKKGSLNGASITDQRQWFLLTLPALLMVIIFKYIPIFGVIIAFKDYRYDSGIFGSSWVGLDNFKFFFMSMDAKIVIRNALCYNLLFIITGQAIAIFLAILLSNIRNKGLVSVFQNAMFQPFFLSWVVVAYVSLMFLSYQDGILNGLLVKLGHERISWYDEPKYWPFILWFFQMWKGIGYNTLLYFVAILNIDESLYESAKLDGCSTLRSYRYITVPMIVPTIIILLIMGIGAIFNSDFGLFYQIPQNSGAIRSVTDVIETYTFRTLTSAGSAGVAGAVGLIQSAVGLILVIITNAAVKKFSSENALF